MLGISVEISKSNSSQNSLHFAKEKTGSIDRPHNLQATRETHLSRKTIHPRRANLLSRHLHRILDKGHRESKAVSSFGVVKPVFTPSRSWKRSMIQADDDYEKLVL